MKISNNKRAQIGETMTWVVATLVIIVVLAVTIGISKTINTDVAFRSDKGKDLFATISITNFLSNKANSDLLSSGNYDSFNEKARIFMDTLQPEDTLGNFGWNLEVSKAGENLYTYSSGFLSDRFSPFHSINFIKDIKLDFWGSCVLCA